MTFKNFTLQLYRMKTKYSFICNIERPEIVNFFGTGRGSRLMVSLLNCVDKMNIEDLSFVDCSVLTSLFFCD